MADLASILKCRRQELGITLLQIAESVGVSEATVQRWEKGHIRTLRHENLVKLAETLRMKPAELMGWDAPEVLATKVDKQEPYFAPIVGAIPAGYPAVALEDIEGYAPIQYKNEGDYFFLRVSGDSMINAGINNGDLVLIRRQTFANPGQIVACRVDGDEATLKRFKPQGNTVILMPENSAYDPTVVAASDFVCGEAGIIGVAIEVRHTL